MSETPAIAATAKRVVAADLYTRFTPDWAFVYPGFAVAWKAALWEASVESGHDFYSVSLWRSPLDQVGLYLLGRQPGHIGPNATAAKPLGDTVTDVRFGMHNVGCAGDASLDGDTGKRGLQPSTDSTLFAVYHAACRRHRLRVVPRPGDLGHAEIDLAALGISLSHLQAEYRRPSIESEKMAAVFRFLDRYWTPE